MHNFYVPKWLWQVCPFHPQAPHVREATPKTTKEIITIEAESDELLLNADLEAMRLAKLPQRHLARRARLTLVAGDAVASADMGRVAPPKQAFAVLRGHLETSCGHAGAGR